MSVNRRVIEVAVSEAWKVGTKYSLHVALPEAGRGQVFSWFIDSDDVSPNRGDGAVLEEEGERWARIEIVTNLAGRFTARIFSPNQQWSPRRVVFQVVDTAPISGSFETPLRKEETPLVEKDNQELRRKRYRLTKDEINGLWEDTFEAVLVLVTIGFVVFFFLFGQSKKNKKACVIPTPDWDCFYPQRFLIQCGSTSTSKSK